MLDCVEQRSIELTYSDYRFQNLIHRFVAPGIRPIKAAIWIWTMENCKRRNDYAAYYVSTTVAKPDKNEVLAEKDMLA